MKTILEICREVADLAATRRPVDLFNNEGSFFLSIAKSTLNSLLMYKCPELIKVARIPVIKGEKRYKLDIEDFYCLSDNSKYLSDDKMRVTSLVDIKIENDHFILSKEPDSNGFLMFQYHSNNIVWDWNTFEEKNVLTANTDVPVFDEYLVRLGIFWRWLKRMGLEYNEEFEEYKNEVDRRIHCD